MLPQLQGSILIEFESCKLLRRSVEHNRSDHRDLSQKKNGQLVTLAFLPPLMVNDILWSATVPFWSGRKTPCILTTFLDYQQHVLTVILTTSKFLSGKAVHFLSYRNAAFQIPTNPLRQLAYRPPTPWPRTISASSGPSLHLSHIFPSKI